MTETDDGFVPAFILQNKGVPIRLHRLNEAGERARDGEDEDAPFQYRTVHLRFDARAVSALEDAFDGLTATVQVTETTPVLDAQGAPLVGPAGPVIATKVLGVEERRFYGLEAFQKAMEVKPATAIFRSMAIGLGMTDDYLATSMVDGAMIEYQNAVGVAWSMAQGVDPTEAAKVLQKAKAATADLRRNLAAELDGLASSSEKTTVPDSGETDDSPGNHG